MLSRKICGKEAVSLCDGEHKTRANFLSNHQRITESVRCSMKREESI